MSYKVQPSCTTRWLRWSAPKEDQTGFTLPQNDGLVLPTGKLRFFSEIECQAIISIGNNYQTDIAVTGDGGNKVSYSNRNTIVCTLFPDNTTSWIFDKLEFAVEKMIGHFGFDVAGFFEGAQLYRYPTGGFLNPHMDIGKGHMSTRKLGITVQLSAENAYDGGDLEFVDSEQTAPRDLGTIVVFPTYMLHRVSPVTRGERISLVSWVHGPPFR